MEFDIWTQSLLSAMTTLWSKVAGFIPNVFGALVVILAGFAVAKILDTVLSKVLAKLGLDRVLAGAGVTKQLAKIGIRMPAIQLRERADQVQDTLAFV